MMPVHHYSIMVNSKNMRLARFSRKNTYRASGSPPFQLGKFRSVFYDRSSIVNGAYDQESSVLYIYSVLQTHDGN